MKQDKEENGQDNDVDQGFLDQILDKLYDFGDGAKCKRSKKKHKKKKRGNDDEAEEEEAAAEEEEASDEETSSATLSHMNGINHERIPLSTSLGTTSTCATSSNVEIVTFQDPLKKNRLKRAVEPEATPPEVKEKKKKDPDDVLSIEKARLEVHRFGITGFQKEQQRVFEQDRAIMLGARPPKRDFVNYKVYQQTMKEKRLKEKEEARSDTQTKKRKPGKSDKQKTEKRRKEPGFSGGETTGRVGRFKNGMLVLSNKDLQKLKVKVRK